ncbi:NADH:flavin oxidoreductase [Aliamphritea hakodatensis]|uniref:NADH:flavin oxidoreductase n=1 Tax=Aliamphritea hakodatensis TaxID=2895352 RepID=UPI0022FD5F6B|nr:NADH:flavin oxidoreductase [Aliamphritea hakodatensis]
MSNETTNLFSNFKIGNMALKNRLVVAPMTRVSAYEDGTAGPLMKDYYQAFAAGGFSLIITEGLYTDKHFSQGYKYQPGLADETHMESWKTITEAVHKAGSKIIAQLMHAGALSQYNKYTGQSAAPSAVKPLGEEMTFYYGNGEYSTPKEISQEEIEDVIAGFVHAARLAKEAGFDGVEIHGANGYLLDQFLTVYTNKRTDRFGGNLANRLNLYKEIITSVRHAVGAEFILGVRFSQGKVNDFEYKWPAKEADARYTFEYISSLGVDYIHTTEHVANAPAFDGHLSLSELAKTSADLPVIANGGINQEKDALKLLNAKKADMLSIGKAALANPDWPNLVESGRQLNEFSFEMFNPIADLRTANDFLRKNHA